MCDMYLMWLDRNHDNDKLSVVVQAGKPAATWYKYWPGKKRNYRTIFSGVHSLVDGWTQNKLTIDEDDEKIKIYIFLKDKKVAEHGFHVMEFSKE